MVDLPTRRRVYVQLLWTLPLYHNKNKATFDCSIPIIYEDAMVHLLQDTFQLPGSCSQQRCQCCGTQSARQVKTLRPCCMS